MGGVPLSGSISKPLLDSLFDPGSAGHDGAVLVESGQISRFAVHLPISKNRQEVGVHGTRHAAALGLSERVDALVIVVSEERGVVSLAEQGKLTVVNSAAELKRRLDAFLQEKFPVTREAFWTHFVVRHWRAKLLSVALASVAWILLAYNPSTVQRIFVVPIEYRNVPKGLEVADTAPTETKVTLSGTEPAFRLLEPATLKIAVDLAHAQSGFVPVHMVPKKHLLVPANLSVFRIQHSNLDLFLRKRPPDPDVPNANASSRTTDEAMPPGE